MSDMQPVLVTVSVLIHAPTEFKALEETLHRVSDQLGKAVQDIIASEPTIERLIGFSYHYLAEEEENAHHCNECGKWATDSDLPHAIDGLPCGSTVGGVFLCEECRAFSQYFPKQSS